jgi:glyoxylase-like metal-dependent hydrolase (beta-lactamase superfamily II)
MSGAGYARARHTTNIRRILIRLRKASSMTTAITLKDITVYPVVEQQGPFFDVMEFFPTLTKELLEENRSWLEPTFIEVLCVQSFVVKTPRHNILIDSCVGNHKPRPARPFWNMMNSDRFERGLAAAELTVNDIDYVMCTHLHVDHVGWNTRLENGRSVPTRVVHSHDLARGRVQSQGVPTGAAAAFMIRTDNDASGEPVVVVVAPFAGWAGAVGAFED